MLERRGIISGYEGSKPRQVLITEADVPRILIPSGRGRRRGAARAGRRRRRRRRRAATRAPARPDSAPASPIAPLAFGSRWPTSARRCGRRGCAPGSTSTRSRPGPRSAPSTCARWRTRSGTCSRAGLRQELPAHLRRLPGARQPPADRRVQAPLRAPLRPRAAPDRHAQPRARARRSRARCCPRGRSSAVVLVAVVVALYFVGTSGNNSKPRRRRHERARRRTTDAQASPPQHRRRRAAADDGQAPARARPARVYVCLVDGTGKKLIPGQIFNTGQTIPTETAPKLLLTLGNASVQMKVNGTSVTVARPDLDRVPARRRRAHAAARRPSSRAAHERAPGAARRPAGILITGTEVLTGIISDRNGPWLSERLRELGVDAAMIQIVGDRPEDLLAALEYMARRGDGGDRHQRRPRPDRRRPDRRGRRPLLRPRDGARRRARGADRRDPRPMMSRWPGLDPDAIRASNRKQAVIPAGATMLEPVGTAPGLVVPPAEGRRARRSSCCPGRRASCSRCGGRRRDRGVPRRDRRRHDLPPRDRAPVRNPGVGDRQHAAAAPRPPAWSSPRWRSRPACAAARSRSRRASSPPPSPPTTRCSRSSPSARRHAFSRDGSTIDEQVAALLPAADGRRRRVVHGRAAGGAAHRPAPGPRRTSRAARRLLQRGEVELAGVDPALIERFGAVSTEVAEALADGAPSASTPTSGSGSPGSPGPAAAPRRSRSGTVCFSVCGRGGRRLTRRTRCRAAAPTSATARRPSRCISCAACSSARSASCACRRGWPTPARRSANARERSACAAVRRARTARRRRQRARPLA